MILRFFCTLSFIRACRLVYYTSWKTFSWLDSRYVGFFLCKPHNNIISTANRLIFIFSLSYRSHTLYIPLTYDCKTSKTLSTSLRYRTRSYLNITKTTSNIYYYNKNNFRMEHAYRAHLTIRPTDNTRPRRW